MKATRTRHRWVHMFITHRPTLTLQHQNFDLFRTCRTSSFCTIAWQLARFQLTRRMARSLGDNWASCSTLLILHPCLFRIFFLPLSVLYLLFPNCCSNLPIPPPCFLVSAWSFCHSTCPELIPSLYLSSVVSDHLHTSLSNLLPLPYLKTMDLYSSHVFSSFSFHARTLGSNFLCKLFVALNHMSITSSLCFGTHS